MNPNIGSSHWHSLFKQFSGRFDAMPQFSSSQPLPMSPNSIRSMMTQGEVGKKVTVEKAAGERCVSPRLQGTEVTHTDGFSIPFNHSYTTEDGEGGEGFPRQNKRKKHITRKCHTQMHAI